jgi:hypothetical protein
MTDATVELTYADAQAIWAEWARSPEDALSRHVFERTLREAAGIKDEGLYFRPGGWVVELPATAARVVIAAAVLAAGLPIIGLDDLPKEILLAAASLVSTMNLGPVRLSRAENRLLEQLYTKNLDGVPLSPQDVVDAVRPNARRAVDEDAIADMLDKFVAAGLADSDGDDYVLRSHGGEAWIRLSFGG